MSWLPRVPPWSSGSVLDHRSLPPCSNPGVGISEGCFVFHFVSLPLEVAQPIQPTLCTKVAVKHQSSSSWLPKFFRTGIIPCILARYRKIYGYAHTYTQTLTLVHVCIIPVEKMIRIGKLVLQEQGGDDSDVRCGMFLDKTILITNLLSLANN